MKWLTGWFLDNPVAANLLMAVILISGVLSLGTLRVESFPQPSPTKLEINISYPGGTARQIDESITRRVESALSGVPGIKKIRSVSQQGGSTVTITKSTDTSLDRLVHDVKYRMDAISGLPEKATTPEVTRQEYESLAAFVMVSGDVSSAVLQRTAVRVEQALKQNSAISSVSNYGKLDQQIKIQPDPQQLQRYGLDIAKLHNLIRDWSLQYRSGQLKTVHGDLLVRGDGYADNLLELRNLPVLNTEHGTVRLQDMATITRGYEEDDSIVRYQGKPAITLKVTTSRKDNLFKVSEGIQKVLKEVQPSIPSAVSLDVMADMSPYIKNQLNLLGNNAWQGLLIVLVILGLFLEVKLAFWVALGIPVSLAGALWVMGFKGLDYSINDLTLFGMILSLGILVDDAIVVGESIHESRMRIANPRDAARDGVERVAVATTYGVLTTIAAFSPMLWIENAQAQVLTGFSAVVIMALLFSLVESKFILPSHLCFRKTENLSNPLSRLMGRLRGICLGGLNRFSQSVYQPVLRVALHNRLAALIAFLAFVVLGYGLIYKDVVRTVFFPDIPSRYLTVNVAMDKDAPMVLTRANADKLEQGLVTTNQELQKRYQLAEEPVHGRFIFVGRSRIHVTAELTVEGLRTIPGGELLKLWKKHTGILEGSYSSSFSASDSAGGDTAIRIVTADPDMARLVSKKLQAALMDIKGVLETYDDGQKGQRQIHLSLNERGRQLGLNRRQLATLVGGAFGSLEVYRLLDQGEETKVLIQYNQNQRHTLEQLKETKIQVQGNNYTTLGVVADISFVHEPKTVRRRNREEIMSVFWRQDENVGSPKGTLKQLQKSIIPKLEYDYPGIRIKASGQFEEMAEVQGGFKKAMILTLIMIYVLMAVPLKSYWQPLVIMSVIPFGFAGAIYGHALMGLPISVLSMFGMMAMTGVVINDSLVLMTRFNQLYSEGMPVRKALFEAGSSRMRAIFLTTVTTVCGLLPLLCETSEQAQYLKPTAVSLVFGELVRDTDYSYSYSGDSGVWALSFCKYISPTAKSPAG